MVAFEIELLEPKAEALLESLEQLNLIRIKKDNRLAARERFLELVKEIRSRAEEVGEMSMEEITAEVEAVRAENYQKQQHEKGDF